MHSSSVSCVLIAAALMTFPGASQSVIEEVGSEPGFELTTDSKSVGSTISLTKTVGTDPAVCATFDTVTVGSGTTVYYCYEVTNTGDVAFRYHSLEDDQLGQLLTNFPLALNPGDVYQEIVPTVVSGASVTNTCTWTASTSVGGWVVNDTIPVDFVDISATGTPVVMSDDSTRQIPIGFVFQFYSGSYESFWVSSNGFLSDLDHGHGCCSGDPLPDPETPNGVIAGWWNDLNPGVGGGIHYQTLGTAPHRIFVVQFTDIPHFGGAGGPVTMQFKLFEEIKVIEVHYLAAPSSGGLHSAGVENQDGTIGVQYYLGGDPLPTPIAVRYTSVPTQEAMASDTATVIISDPDIAVDPGSLLCSQLADEIQTLDMAIGNVGTDNLDWSILEDVPRSVPPSQRSFVWGANPPLNGAGPVGVEPGAWNRPSADLLVPGAVAFSNDGNHLNHVTFDPMAPETLTIIGPATGIFEAGDFVGGDRSKTYQIKHPNELVVVDVDTGAESVIGFLPTLTPPQFYTGMAYDPSTGNTYVTSSDGASSSTLFVIDVAAATSSMVGTITNSPGSVAIAADGAGQLYTCDMVNDVLMAVDKDTGAGTPIGPVGFDATSITGMDYDSWTGTMYMTAFGSTTFQAELRVVDVATGHTTFVGVLGSVDPGDDVRLAWVAFRDPPCFSPSDVAWLSVAPENGTIAPGGTTQVDVTCDSTGVPVGVYEAVICVFSDDPDESLVLVPTAMEVLIPVELMSIDVE